MNWKTKSGQTLKIEEMTDDHIVNSIHYCEERGDFRSAEVVRNEHRRRWMAEERDCIWCCPGKMTRCEDYDEDSWLNDWRWYCNKCGARSGVVDGYSVPVKKKRLTGR